MTEEATKEPQRVCGSVQRPSRVTMRLIRGHPAHSPVTGGVPALSRIRHYPPRTNRNPSPIHRSPTRKLGIPAPPSASVASAPVPTAAPAAPSPITVSSSPTHHSPAPSLIRKNRTSLPHLPCLQVPPKCSSTWQSYSCAAHITTHVRHDFVGGTQRLRHATVAFLLPLCPSHEAMVRVCHFMRRVALRLPR